jgi:hypothetical protein
VWHYWGFLFFALDIILFVIRMSLKNNLPNIIHQVAFRSEVVEAHLSIRFQYLKLETNRSLL